MGSSQSTRQRTPSHRQAGPIVRSQDFEDEASQITSKNATSLLPETVGDSFSKRLNIVSNLNIEEKEIDDKMTTEIQQDIPIVTVTGNNTILSYFKLFFTLI